MSGKLGNNFDINTHTHTQSKSRPYGSEIYFMKITLNKLLITKVKNRDKPTVYIYNIKI